MEIPFSSAMVLHTLHLPRYIKVTSNPRPLPTTMKRMSGQLQQLLVSSQRRTGSKRQSRQIVYHWAEKFLNLHCMVLGILGSMGSVAFKRSFVDIVLFYAINGSACIFWRHVRFEPSLSLFVISIPNKDSP
jgi:hypothetical protein